MSAETNRRSKTLFYLFAYSIVWLFFHVLFRVRVQGVENIPESGGVIIASNHVSNLDPLFVGVFVPRYIQFMAKAELFQARMLRNLFLALGGFPVKRGKVDLHAIRKAVDVVTSSGCLVMFPEGHRSKTGVLGKLMPGIVAISKKSGGVVVPTAVVGPYRAFRRLEIRFGQPIVFDTNLANDELVSILRERMQDLLAINGDRS